ncbi:hypothetical protein Psed_6889 (plasmid) [Pseudonocardia dioxanivorans CB1190]|uniref:Uncharacterized protein n=1 Tax=Pseudonocardia dioxanivorans (strain ATCC 55486 / DSM 44775 / JCM 13855 / CB1190) TaxID=675635 RepID=F2L6Y4_PSEUX|nr:hypothetical protein [Pseudonocardia dioxanivorans]AEA28957.1 hypothetical protein Psed_6889 [Pseudonocardia dioxanivorans CB1190]
MCFPGENATSAELAAKLIKLDELIGRGFGRSNEEVIWWGVDRVDGRVRRADDRTRSPSSSRTRNSRL